jgi:hypothetical protein
MDNLLIIGYSNPTNEGITLHFNKPFDLNGGISSEDWWLSWDKIGKAICGDRYCTETDVCELNKLRGKTNG